jgi:C4-dicarboxylate-specific signal transduction histidine kinase
MVPAAAVASGVHQGLMDLQAKIAEFERNAAARIQQIEQRVARERVEAEERIRRNQRKAAQERAQAEERIRRNEQKAVQERAHAEDRIQQIQQSFVQEKKSHELDLLLEILKRVSSFGSKSESQQRTTLEGGINFNNLLCSRKQLF